MNTARLLIDVIPWLTVVSVLALPFGSEPVQRGLALLLFLCLVTLTAIGVWQYSHRDPDDQ